MSHPIVIIIPLYFIKMIVWKFYLIFLFVEDIIVEYNNSLNIVLFIHLFVDFQYLIFDLIILVYPLNYNIINY